MENRRDFLTALAPRLGMAYLALQGGSAWLPRAAHAAAEPLADFLNTPHYRELLDTLVDTHGFDRAQLLQWLGQVEVRKKIIKIFKRPAEAKPYHEYRHLFANDRVFTLGRAYLKEHDALLKQVDDKYGVHPTLVAAILGIETKFGTVKSGYPMFDVLNTAFSLYERRRKFYRKELIEYLLMCREEALSPLEVKGSYAGAFGMAQFIPSSYRAYAVDFDGDGRRDLWTSHADAAGSVANYMKVHGWRTGEPMKAEVTLSDAVAEKFSGGHKERFSLQRLTDAGVSSPIFTRVAPDAKVAVVSYDEADGRTRRFVVFNNFATVMRYNISVNYAMVASELDDYFRAHRGEKAA